MSDLHEPLPVLFFASFLYHQNKHNLDELKKLWSDRFGASLVFHHPYFPMKSYYSKEMGEENKLSRFFIVAETLQNRNQLVEHKIWADAQERLFGPANARSVNIDPGYISLENVILSTGKNYSHRVFLERGVYAELTLIFKQPSFCATSWCYPDYAHPEVIDFFNWTRQFLLVKVKGQKS